MVAFTSPNFAWLDGMTKAQNHIELYMPVWTLDELCDANELLGNQLEFDVIEERFDLFGGTARWCLALDFDFYKTAVQELLQKIHSITSFDTIKDCLDKKADKADIAHRVFHYKPKKSETTNLPRFYELDFGSISILKMVEDNIHDKSEKERNKLVNWMKGNPKCSNLLGWLFEGHSNAILSDGGEFTIHSLTDSSCQKIKLERNRYLPARTDNYESIDGYYFDSPNQLDLFQITLNYNHPVKAHGIINHIKSMPQLTADIDLRLIFTVPKNMGDYKKQAIVEDASQSTFSLTFSYGLSRLRN
jgi:hypothetical protein